MPTRTRERLLNNRAYDGAMRLVSGAPRANVHARNTLPDPALTTARVRNMCCVATDSVSGLELSYALQQHENVVRVNQVAWAHSTPRVRRLARAQSCSDGGRADVMAK